jgi:hypothetical protein
MANAAKKIWAPGEYEAACVAHAVSVDPARDHLNKPFGQEMNGRGFVCGTDGHRLSAVACEAWSGFKRDNAPPAVQVIPWGAKWRGEFPAVALEDTRAFTSRWDVSLDVQPQAMLMHASVRTGSGKKSKALYPFGRDGVRVDYFKLEQLTYSFGIALCYLLDAVDFIGTGSIHVWSQDYPKKLDQELAPLVFTGPGVKSIPEANRIAVVMPRRI